MYKNGCYEERLKKLKLYFWVKRRWNWDLIETYKFLSGSEDVEVNKFCKIANNNNNASVFILRRLHQDDNERVITTLWTEAHYIYRWWAESVVGSTRVTSATLNLHVQAATNYTPSPSRHYYPPTNCRYQFTDPEKMDSLEGNEPSSWTTVTITINELYIIKKECF